jgi:hypothetical protein
MRHYRRDLLPLRPSADQRGYRNVGIVESSVWSGNEAPNESARDGRRSFVKSHLGISANVQTEPPVGILAAA